MIAEQGQLEGLDWLSAVWGRGLAWVSDAIRWTATEDSLWSFSTVETKMPKQNDAGVLQNSRSSWREQNKQE